MTREDAILHMILRREELKHSVGDLDEDIKAFDMAIKALEQEPCWDAISRVAAIDKLDEWDWQEFYLPIHFKELLDELPNVSVKEKTGRWIDRFPLKECKCSECDYLIMLSFGSFSEVVKQMRYCPNCGCRMMEVEE